MYEKIAADVRDLYKGMLLFEILVLYYFLTRGADDAECPNVESLVFQVKSLGSFFRSQKETLAQCDPLYWWRTKGGKHVTTFIQGNI